MFGDFSTFYIKCLNPLSANPTEWSNLLKQFFRWQRVFKNQRGQDPSANYVQASYVQLNCHRIMFRAAVIRNKGKIKVLVTYFNQTLPPLLSYKKLRGLKAVSVCLFKDQFLAIVEGTASLTQCYSLHFVIHISIRKSLVLVTRLVIKIG